MGELLKVLDRAEFETEGTYNSVRYESAECIHFHWRDYRIVLTPQQFNAMTDCAKVARQNFTGEKGEGNGILLSEEWIKDQSPKDIVIELNKAGVHVHLRDFRLEMDENDFLCLADSMTRAARELRNENQDHNS